MGFGWRRKRTDSKKKEVKSKIDHLTIPNHFLCPISLDLMKDPVTLSSGITYDRESIETWLEAGNFNCPLTNQVLRSFDQIPNHTLRKMIQDWCVENRRYGVERIPTPHVPVSPIEVSEALFGVEDATKRLDQCDCLDLVKKINKWSVESERNRRCIEANGASGVLAAAFDAFSRDSIERNTALLEEILYAINWMFSLDAEACARLGSDGALRGIVWFLNGEQLSTIENSIMVLKELLSSKNHQQNVEALANIGGVNEVLLKFIRNPVSPSIKKASLLVLFYIVSSPSPSTQNTKSEFAKMGLVSLLLEIIFDTESERNTIERALGVLDALCDCEEGREEAYNNALTSAVLVKKILRVTPLASEYSVSAIWKLVKYEKNHENRVLVEALQVGAFQKLVLLLQLGCDSETKEKATELLKQMNPYRAETECIESVDFKNLKRSF